MSTHAIKTIAIVGSGFSGTATAINLLRLADETATPVRIILIGTASSYGKGLAYSTEDDNLVLNVPAGNMSLFPDKPDDFLEFCNGMDAALLSGFFVFRRIYGEYLETRLNEASSSHADTLIQIRDFVTGIAQQDNTFTLNLQAGAPVHADSVVLAFGHFPPRPLAEILGKQTFDPSISEEACLDNPWDIHALDRLPKDKDVLIVGTGHTAIDTLFRLTSCSSQRKIYLVSRHGHAPNGHRKVGEFVKIPTLVNEVESTVRNILADTPSIRQLFSAIRKHVQQHVARQGNWRDVINGLRQITPEVWGRLPVAERARFLRHVVHHWDVLRHRIAPMAIRRLNGLLHSGRVEIIAGRITRLERASDGGDLRATIKLRGTDSQRDLLIGSVINCSGPSYDIQRITNPLVRQLAAAGILRQDEVKIGFAVDDGYRCSSLPNLYYIGPMLKARYWEAIAVPELRAHALNLAKAILAHIGKT